MALISFIIIIIICIRKKKKHNPSPSNMDILDPDFSRSNDIIIPKFHKYEEGSQKEENIKTVKFLLTTTGQYKVYIIIDPYKTIKELIQFYFETIKKPYLYGDPDIRFIWSATLIPHDSNDLIKFYLKESDYDSLNTIVIDDVEEKIKSTRINKLI